MWIAGLLMSVATAAAADGAKAASTALAVGTAVVSVAPEPLTAATFKPFGEVVEIPVSTPPTLQTDVLRTWNGLAKARFHEEIEFGMYQAKAREHEVAELERHTRTPEFLVSLGGEFLLAVAPPSVGTGGPVAAKVRVFRVMPGQAVVLLRGTWHALPFPKAAEGLFLFAWREGTGKKDAKVKPFRGRDVVKF